jgi:hypothetical protein
MIELPTRLQQQVHRFGPLFENSPDFPFELIETPHVI